MNSDSTSPSVIPVIPAVPEGIPRPFWSVMVPTYNCDDLLVLTLRSLLDQDPGPERMEIVVVDDCSPGAARADEIVRRLAPARIGFHRHERNLGLSGNWNACIARSRGQWVHLLHQDDLVLPGFYERLGRADHERPDIGAAFCRHSTIDPEGNPENLSARERSEPGVLENWLDAIAAQQRVGCPAIVVKRLVYEQVGGFRSDLVYAVDWEMWVRIAASFAFWYEPEPLTCHRAHGGSETSRLVRDGIDLLDERRAIDLIAELLPPDRRRAARRGGLRRLAHRQLDRASAPLSSGNITAGFLAIHRAIGYDKSVLFTRSMFGYAKWLLKLWARGLLPESRPGVR